jgi:nitrite reductase/ring-hydroxylating ferredoxin subunit
MGVWIPIAAARDCVPNQGNPFEVDGQLIAVFTVEGRFFATSNCVHASVRTVERGMGRWRICRMPDASGPLSCSYRLRSRGACLESPSDLSAAGS